MALPCVQEVRARDNERVDVAGIQQRIEAGHSLRVARQRQGGVSHAVVGLEDAGDDTAGHERQVAQVLLAHHAAAHEAVAKGGDHAPDCRREGTDARQAPFDAPRDGGTTPP
jgi:hypothetical protein